MASKKPVRIMVVEGKDDAAALFAWAKVLAPGKSTRADTVQSYAKGEFSHETEDVTLRVLVAERGKSTLAQRVLDGVDRSATERPALFGVCFDPDNDDEDRERKFFEREFKSIGEKAQGAGPLETIAPGEYSFKKAGREGRVLLAPWRVAGGGYTNLPDEHNLERVLIQGILAGSPPASLESWATDATRTLYELTRDHGWKRAFRLWNAALHPDTSESSFVDAVLQRGGLQHACFAAMANTPVHDVMRRLLTV